MFASTSDLAGIRLKSEQLPSASITDCSGLVASRTLDLLSPMHGLTYQRTAVLPMLPMTKACMAFDHTRCTAGAFSPSSGDSVCLQPASCKSAMLTSQARSEASATGQRRAQGADPVPEPMGGSWPCALNQGLHPALTYKHQCLRSGGKLPYP
jgi:hypothetical protein